MVSHTANGIFNETTLVLGDVCQLTINGVVAT